MKHLLVIIAGVLFAFSASLSATELSPSEQAAKEKGIALYNQYKADSAEPYLEIAAKAGDREAQYYLGEAIRLNNSYMTREAHKWYVAAAKQGDYYAMFRLADTSSDLCQAMSNCPPDTQSREDWIKLLWETAKPLAEQGDGEAMMIMYSTTPGLEWLERSADAGYARAQWLLANRYQEGRGFFFLPWKRSEKIEELLKKSAEGGFIKGMDEYTAILWEKGDMAGVRYWIQKCAELGLAGAVGTYAAYISHEPNKVDYPLDLVKGYGLLTLLLELDGGGGMDYYAEQKLPLVEAKMTPEQIEQAKVFAQEWKATHPPLSYFPDKLGF